MILKSFTFLFVHEKKKLFLQKKLTQKLYFSLKCMYKEKHKQTKSKRKNNKMLLLFYIFSSIIIIITVIL